MMKGRTIIFIELLIGGFYSLLMADGRSVKDWLDLASDKPDFEVIEEKRFFPHKPLLGLLDLERAQKTIDASSGTSVVQGYKRNTLKCLELRLRRNPTLRALAEETISEYRVGLASGIREGGLLAPKPSFSSDSKRAIEDYLDLASDRRFR